MTSRENLQSIQKRNLQKQEDLLRKQQRQVLRQLQNGIVCFIAYKSCFCSIYAHVPCMHVQRFLFS